MTYSRNAKYREKDFDNAWLRELLKHAKYCPYCLVEMTDFGDMKTSKTIDHIIPLALGGKHEKRNIEIICWVCNVIKKNKKTKEEFIQLFAV